MEHIKGSDCEILTGEGFLWKAAKDGQVPEGAVQVNISRHKQKYYEQQLQKLIDKNNMKSNKQTYQRTNK